MYFHGCLLNTSLKGPFYSVNGAAQFCVGRKAEALFLSSDMMRLGKPRVLSVYFQSADDIDLSLSHLVRVCDG